VCKAGTKDRSKGATREIAPNQQDRRTDLVACRAWLSIVFVFLKWAIIPGREPRLIIINLTEMVFPSGFFQGLFTQKSLVQCVWFLFYLLPLYVSLNNSVVLLFNKSVLFEIIRQCWVTKN
jgi:hypothetical protein